LQKAGNVRDIKAWLMGFIVRIELGYNTTKILYVPVTDLLNSRNTLLPRGALNFVKASQKPKNVAEFLAGLRFEQRGKMDMVI
jgi:hypothetical protein